MAAARKAPADCEIKLLRTAWAWSGRSRSATRRPGGYGWASAEGISYALERMVTDAAHRLGELALAAGDPGLAEWAARQGQRAVPGHEGLYRDLALAKLHQGDVDGFMAVRREAEAAATTFDALDGLQPETQEFFTTALAEYNDLRQAPTTTDLRPGRGPRRGGDRRTAKASTPPAGRRGAARCAGGGCARPGRPGR